MSATKAQTPVAAAISVGSGLMLPMALAALSLVSAIAVVQIKHETRRLHDHSNDLLVEHEQLDVAWSQLQLEEAAHSDHARIEQKARLQLRMIEPQQPVNVGASVNAATSEPLP